jgi:hypothetical protein
LSTSERSTSDCRESSEAAPRTWFAAAPVSLAAVVTPLMFSDTWPVRAIS